MPLWAAGLYSVRVLTFNILENLGVLFHCHKYDIISPTEHNPVSAGSIIITKTV